MIAVLLFIVFSVVFIIPRNTVNNLQGRNSTELTAVESKEGNQRRLDYVDENGAITFAADKKYATLLETLDPDGNVVLEKFFDENGEPAAQSGRYYGRAYIYDKEGQRIKTTYLDLDGNPVLTNSGYAIVKRTYNKDGQVETEMYYGTDGKQIAIGYGQYGEAYLYNEIGKKSQITYLDRDGRAMLNTNGYAIVKRTYNEDGSLDTDTYYGLDGEPIALKYGQYGTKHVNGKTIKLNKDGQPIFNLMSFLYSHSYVVIAAGFLLCFVAVLLPKPLKIIFLLLYIFFIVCMTLLFRESGESRGVFTVFWSYRQFFSNRYYATEILQNIWLFVPLGAVMYSVSKKRILIVVPFLLSMVIELIQLIFGLGAFEFDDIISNTLGGLLGFLIAYLLTSLLRRKNV